MSISNIAESSPEPLAKARKSQTTVLSRLAPQGTQGRIAALLEIDDATVSRWKGDLERTCLILTHLGLKVVGAEQVCVPADEIKMLRRAYRLACTHAPWVLDEADE